MCRTRGFSTLGLAARNVVKRVGMEKARAEALAVAGGKAAGSGQPLRIVGDDDAKLDARALISHSRALSAPCRWGLRTAAMGASRPGNGNPTSGDGGQ